MLINASNAPGANGMHSLVQMFSTFILYFIFKGWIKFKASKLNVSFGHGCENVELQFKTWKDGQIKSDEWKKSQPGAKIAQSGDTALPCSEFETKKGFEQRKVGKKSSEKSSKKWRYCSALFRI